MKTLSIIAYTIGAILLVVSCFTSAPTAMWWLGGISVVMLIAGCVFQYYATKDNYTPHHKHP